MRKILICFAAAATAAAVATPAAADRGRYDNMAVRIYVSRVVELQAKINRLDKRDILSRREARRLRGEAAALRALVGIKSNNGLNNAERIEIDFRIARLEQEIRRESRDGDRRWGDRRDDRYHTLPVDQDGDRYRTDSND
jgi:hypothetical protein